MLFSSEPAIKLIAMDVDGVLTDGTLYLSANGEESKRFSVQDGLGLKLANRAGLITAWITGRGSPIVARRARELDITEVMQEINDKGAAIDELLKKYNLRESQIAYIGDDLNDLPAMKKAGLPIAVANAVDEVKAAAQFITELPGGAGAVREVITHILKKKGMWKELMERYFHLAG